MHGLAALCLVVHHGLGSVLCVFGIFRVFGVGGIYRHARAASTHLFDHLGYVLGLRILRVSRQAKTEHVSKWIFHCELLGWHCILNPRFASRPAFGNQRNVIAKNLPLVKSVSLAGELVGIPARQFPLASIHGANGICGLDDNIGQHRPIARLKRLRPFANILKMPVAESPVAIGVEQFAGMRDP